MQCSIMMFENKDRFGISFKLNAPDFVIYARRFFHNFTIHISRADNEGAVGANLSKKGEYVMADKTQVQIFCQKDFEKKQSWSATRGELQIFYLSVSESQDRLGVSVGRMLVREQEKVQEI